MFQMHKSEIHPRRVYPTPVPGLGEIIEIRETFYNQLKILSQQNLNPISLRDEAFVRVSTFRQETYAGREKNIGKYVGTWTSAGLEFVANQFPILRINSRLLNPELALAVTKQNRKRGYFCTPSVKEYEQSLKEANADLSKDPKDRNAVILPLRNDFEIGLEQSEIFEAIFKDKAKEYYRLVNENISDLKSNDGKTPLVKPHRVLLVNPSEVDTYKGTLLTQISLGIPSTGSLIDGGSEIMHEKYVMRSVARNPDLSKPFK